MGAADFAPPKAVTAAAAPSLRAMVGGATARSTGSFSRTAASKGMFGTGLAAAGAVAGITGAGAGALATTGAARSLRTEFLTTAVSAAGAKGIESVTGEGEAGTDFGPGALTTTGAARYRVEVGETLIGAATAAGEGVAAGGVRGAGLASGSDTTGAGAIPDNSGASTVRLLAIRASSRVREGDK